MRHVQTHRLDSRAADRAPLSRRIRIARVFLLLPLPLLAYMLMSLPLPPVAREWQPWAILPAELVLAVSCFVGLGRRRRWGGKLAIALGVFAAAVLVARALPALIELARWHGTAALLAAGAISAGAQTLLAAAGLLAWLSRRELALKPWRGG
jgi:hypothetical protein